jgi:cell division protein FtsX
VILSFSIFFLRGIFTTFRNDIQVKKLLWATKSQIISPFLSIVLYGILGGFVVSLLLLIISLYVFDYYMLPLFNVALIPLLFMQWKLVLLVAIGELILIIAPLMGISYNFISTLHKKLR